MKTVRIWNENASERQLREIVECLEDGQTVIMPTDTLYGITCDALNAKAIEKICALKHINPDKTNLSIICDSISMAAEYARIDNTAFQLMKEETPGPVTYLLKTASTLPKAFKGRKTVGIRIPDNKICRDVVSMIGRPLLTTSIEYADDDYARDPGLIAETYENRVDMMVDGGDGSTVPSAIIDCTGREPVIVRERD